MDSAYTVETAKIVGSPADGFWSQIHTFFPQDDLKKEKRGILLAVLVVSGVEEGIEAVAQGREILGRLHEEYYGETEQTAFEKLSEAVRKVGIENDGSTIIAASLLKNVLNLAIFGRGKIILKRKNKIGIILQGAPQKLHTGSGYLEESDLILLGSDRFFETVETGVLKAALENNLLDDMVEILTPLILGVQNLPDVAVLLALVKKQEEALIGMVGSVEEKEPVIEPEKKKINFFQRKSLFVHRGDGGKKKKMLFLISLVLIGLLVVSVGFGLKKKLTEKKNEKVRQLISLAEEKFNSGKTAYFLNPSEGKNLIDEAKKAADEGLAIKKDSQELIFLKERMAIFLENSATEISIFDAPVFMDLNLIADGAKGNAFSLSEKDLAILDADKKKVYLLNIEKKSNVVYDFLNEKARFVTVLDDKIAVFSAKGVEKINMGSKKVTPVIDADENWKEILAFSSFGGNLYLLDRGASDIWRYLGSNNGYGAAKSWFIGSPPDLSKAVSFAIDGSIWVLEKDNILKFTLNKPDNFVLSKMPVSPPASQRGEQGGPEAFDNPVKIYTSVDEQNLYVLDKGRGKIYVIAKTGEFKIAYTGETVKQADDFVVRESAKKIFLLSGARIYEMTMK